MNVIDLVMLFVIVANIAVIGLADDNANNPSIFAIDIVISLIFLPEVGAKFNLLGCRKYWAPLGSFDTVIVATDVAQFFLKVGYPTVAENVTENGGNSATALRVLRLVRLTRVIKIFRFVFLEDLISMINGMWSGMPTLSCSIALFGTAILIVSFVLRQALGHMEDDVIYKHFGTMSYSTITVFRCSFGDCSTYQGVPLIDVLGREYGAPLGILACLSVFFVTIGLFNVISAIFVDAMVNDTTAQKIAESEARLQNDSLFSSRMKIFLDNVVEVHRDHLLDVSSKTAKTILDRSGFDLTEIDDLSSISNPEDLMKVAVTSHDIQAAVTHKGVRKALSQLDIHQGDWPVLADILDPQNDNFVPIIQIVEGISRLRGPPRRSDIVTVDLMVRDIQLNIGKLMTEVHEIKEHIYFSAPSVFEDISPRVAPKHSEDSDDGDLTINV